MEWQAVLDSLSDVERVALAKGVIAGDVSPAGLARYARIHVADAESLMAKCFRSGIVGEGGVVDPAVRARLTADVPFAEAAEVHAAAARHLMTGGPSQLLAAVEHARVAGALVPLDELVSMADRGGQMSLSLHDYEAAHDLLRLADDIDVGGSESQRGNRLCDLATALDGLGRVDEARALLARAAALGEVAGDPSLIARAAVQYALPIDWFAGDPRSAALLQRAETVPLTAGEKAMVKAARALVEMRIPVSPVDGQQLAWVTRPDVAHGLADEALEASETMGPEERGFAALAWRTVHRSPSVLSQRREMSTKALNLAQQLRRPAQQVEAAVWLAADAIESGDRPLFDEALSVARWVAERDGNPRLKWRAFTLAAGAAHLDGDLESGAEYRRLANECAEPIALPGWIGADMLFTGQEVMSRADSEETKGYLFGEEFVGNINPIGRAVVALAHARVGDKDFADRLTRRSLRQLDMEASYIFLATRCADVALVLGTDDLVDKVIQALAPWRSHVSVDSNAWWCDGPVSIWLAALHARRGEWSEARDYLDEGEPTARDINDVRSLRRASMLRVDIESAQSPGGSVHPLRLVQPDLLSDREARVLSLLALGATNREIAAALSFSVGTIRADTMAIYRKLEVSGRVEAVSRAISLGLIAPTP